MDVDVHDEPWILLLQKNAELNKYYISIYKK
jgi:hypothetical protein